MSTQAPVWFVALMGEYLAAWRQEPTARIVASYWVVLEDCDEGSMRRAALDLERAGGEFPRSSGDWYRRAIDLDRSARLAESMRPSRDEPWHFDDPDCEDTGFLRRHCLGTGQDDCRFCRQYGPRQHEWVEPCSCRATNATYRRKRERERLRPQREERPRKDKGTTGGWSKTSARDWTAA